LVYICSNRTLLAFDKLTGDRAWQIESTQRYHNSIAVDENYVYTCHGDSIVSLEKENGNVHWSYTIPGGQIPDLSAGAIAISDSFVCISIWENADKNGQLYTLDKITGDYRWNYTFDSTGVYSPGIANGIVYAINWKAGSVSGLNLNTGQMVFFDDSESYLKECIIADGKLFTGTFGKVVTFENYGTGIDPVQTDQQKSPEWLRNWPNPFNESTRFEFNLLQAGYLDISVYDITGNIVKTLAAERFEAGSYNLSWDGTNDRSQKVPPGIYILKLSNRHYIKSSRMILLK
jgi:outer membrane protein assembly factor BamB